jgi:hypothetical protein
MLAPPLTEQELDHLQWTPLGYYLRELNPQNGLVRDRTETGAPASIAAVGLALATAPVAVERKVRPRELIAELARRALRFFHESPQGPEPDATGYKGFYYHFLDMQTGRRAGGCELSTIDSTFLFAGMLTAAAYFDAETEVEREVRRLAQELYARADWEWALAGGPAVCHGWRPEGGFLPHRWTGYDEGLLLYVLGLGSPTHPLPPESYAAYCATYQWKTIYGLDLLYSGPLFTHQLSHMWIDFRGIRDAFMREHGSDYFENSRKATYVHQQYAICNPLEFVGYSADCWGLTACDGPGWVTRKVGGVERHFFDYVARGAPYGPDDGTIAPWVVVASLPFAPEIVIPAVRHFEVEDLGVVEPYGFRPSFNKTFAVEGGRGYWVSPWYFGIDQGPIVLMVENSRTGLVWDLTRRCPVFVEGLRKAGFAGGWL